MTTETDSPPSDPTEAQQGSGGDCVSRLVRHWRWIVWPALIGGGFALLCWLMSAWLGGMKDGVTGWWKSIEDPTERGCAYIATAIAAHALVMAFKTMSHDSIKVEVKK